MSKRAAMKIPKYRRYSSVSGLSYALVELAGKRIHLGPYGSPASLEKYHRLLADWQASGRKLPPAAALTGGNATCDLLIIDLIAHYWAQTESVYRDGEGQPTSRTGILKTTLGMLRDLFGHSPAASFGPRSLRTLQSAMVEKRWCRRSINDRINEVRRVFKWAVAEEMVSADIWHALKAVEGLRAGRTAAPESKKVLPVPDADIEAILLFVSSTIAALVKLQLLTAARPGELLIMRRKDIDRQGNIWLYCPTRHKTAHHGHSREIPLGPRAQALLAPLLMNRSESAFLFSPIEAEKERRRELRLQRKTPVQPSQRNRRKKNPQQQPGDRYDTHSYGRAIARACKVATLRIGHPTDCATPLQRASARMTALKLQALFLVTRTRA